MPRDRRSGRRAISVPYPALTDPRSAGSARAMAASRSAVRPTGSAILTLRRPRGTAVTAHGWLGLVASTACRMSWVAASGWDRNETCEAATSTIVALARSAMNRWSAGGIALSWVPSRYQHGSVFHAGGPDGAAAKAAAAYGRWAAAST